MYLADTNVISELARSRPDPQVVAWAAGVSTIALSVVSLEEIAFGLAWKPNPRVQAWLERFFQAACEVLPVTETIARRCGQLRGQLWARGKPRTQADLLIAVTAQVHGLTLVTRNSRDFEDCGIGLLNPFR